MIYKDLVIVQVDRQKDSFVAAYRLKDGTEAWRTAREEIPSWSTPTVYQGPPRDELVTQATKFIRGYDPATGKELWRLGPNSEITTPTPIVAHGLVYVTNGYGGIQPIYAIKPGGNGDLTLQGDATSSAYIAWSTQRGGPYTPTPVVYEDLLYVVTNQRRPLARTTRRRGSAPTRSAWRGRAAPSARRRWRRTARSTWPARTATCSSCKAGRKPEWLATNPMGEVLMATPAISDGVLYVRGMAHLFAIGAR